MESVVSVGIKGVGQEVNTPLKNKNMNKVHSFYTWRFTYEKVESLESLNCCLEHIGYSKYSVEQGANGQKHFQGFSQPHGTCRWKLKRIRDLFLKSFPSLRFPKLDYCEGMAKNSWSAALDAYVSKEETHLEGPFEIGELVGSLKSKPKVVTYDLVLEDLPELYPWQKKLAEFHSGPPPAFHRKVYWYWDPKGNIGKTMLARYLILKENAIYCQGADRHITALAYKNPSFHYVFGLARYDRVDYKTLEKLGDGVFMSGFGTENLGMVCRKSPWIICLSNFKPCLSKLSTDRWVIVNVAEEENLYDCEGLLSSEESEEESS